MAPEYAGLLNALANTLGNYCGFVTAAMAGFLFDTLEDDEKAWNYIFIINGGIALTCGTYFQVYPVDPGALSGLTHIYRKREKKDLESFIQVSSLLYLCKQQDLNGHYNQKTHLFSTIKKMI